MKESDGVFYSMHFMSDRDLISATRAHDYPSAGGNSKTNLPTGRLIVLHAQTFE